MSAAEVERVALTVTEAAEALGVHPDTVRRLITDGRLPTVPTGTRRQLVPVDALRAFANSGARHLKAAS